ncbi:MAG: hypothetical protein HQK63_07755 [Desulfamplus sp.]|nr:hypothetical protein [Desulfamplus sp.]
MLTLFDKFLLISFSLLLTIIVFFILSRKRRKREYELLNNINIGILIIHTSGKIVFYNTFFTSIFKKISTWLPIKDLKELTAYNYFDFYLNPEEQKKLFHNTLNFPITSVLDIGSEIISAQATPISKNFSNFYGTVFSFIKKLLSYFNIDISQDRIMVTWELITRERNQKRWEKVVEDQIENTSGELTAASMELMTSSFKVQEIAQGTSRQAQDVASFSREVTELILKLGEAVNQSSSKFKVIAENVENSREISETALNESQSTRMLITDLSSMASSISKTTQTIQEIMAQTHVLALNANIEAVKAGSAGRGFAVIAKEVGNLAKQTATMSEEITHVVEQILDKIPLSVSSIETVEEVVRKMNSITLSINDLMVEQTQMMGTMNEHMSEANQNSEQITKRMDEVVSYSYSTLEEIEKSQNAGKNIESIAELFNLIVSRFGEERIVTPNDIYHMLIIIQQLIDAWIRISVSSQLWDQTQKIGLEHFDGKKPANVLKISIDNYHLILSLNQMPVENIPFPKGTVTPTQTYNFLSHLLNLAEKILTQKLSSTRSDLNIDQLKIARPVTGKNPSDAYAIANKISKKLELVSKNLKV